MNKHIIMLHVVFFYMYFESKDCKEARDKSFLDHINKVVIADILFRLKVIFDGLYFMKGLF